MNSLAILLILAFIGVELCFCDEVDNDTGSTYSDLYGGDYDGCLLAPMCESCPEGKYLKVDENKCLTCECFNPCEEASCEHGCVVEVDIVTAGGDPIYVAKCQSINNKLFHDHLQNSDLAQLEV